MRYNEFYQSSIRFNKMLHSNKIIIKERITLINDGNQVITTDYIYYLLFILVCQGYEEA